MVKHNIFYILAPASKKLDKISRDPRTGKGKDCHFVHNIIQFPFIYFLIQYVQKALAFKQSSDHGCGFNLG